MIRLLFGIANAFRSNRRGNVAVITALCAIPLFGFLGFAIDYGTALSNKAKLDQAADAAVLVAITTAKNITNAQGGSVTTPMNALTEGQAAGLLAFKANAGNLAFVTSTPVPTITMAPFANQTITATLTYSSVGMNTNFSKLIGIKTIPLKGTSTASLQIGTYLDFYLLLDVSGSMGLPTSSTGQTQLEAMNKDDIQDFPGGCMFACHFSGYQGFDLTRTNQIELRVDSVENAVCALLTTAKSSESLNNQFRIGIYPFIQYTYAYFALAVLDQGTNYTDAINAVTGGTSGACLSSLSSGGLVGLLDQGVPASHQHPLGTGGTHFENVMTTTGSSTGIGSYITTIGSGATATSPKPFLFLVTDGMDNSQTYPNGNFSGSNPLAFNDQATCSSLKAKGVTISILLTPYVNINTSPKAVSWAISEDNQADAQSSLIADDLKACASSNGTPTGKFFYTANSPSDITTALNAMFAQALQFARITQ